MSASAYLEATEIVEREMANRRGSNEPADFAYLLARAALLNLQLRRGNRGAAETAYRLADELAAGVS